MTESATPIVPIGPTESAGPGCEGVASRHSTLSVNTKRWQFLVQLGMVRSERFTLMSAGIIICALVWLGVRYWLMIDGENTVSRDALKSLAQSIKNTIKLKVQMDLIYQDQVASMWATFPNMSRATFQKLIMSEAYSPGLITVTGMSLIPRLMGSAERSLLENDADSDRLRRECCANANNTGSTCATVAATGLFCTGSNPRYQVTQFGAGGVLVPAVGNSTEYISRVSAEEYMVVDVIEPFSSNAKVWGFNLLSSDARLAAWRSATASGKKTFTRRINLVQSDSSEYGFLVWLPLFKTASGAWTTSMKNPPGNLTPVGSVNGVYKAQKLLTRAIESTYSKDQLQDMTVFLFDDAQELNGRPQFLAAYGSSDPDPYNTFGEKSVSDIMKDDDVSFLMDIDIDNADAHWKVLVSSNQEYFNRLRTMYPEMTLIVGAALLVASTIDRWVGHPRLLEAQITKRKKPNRPNRGGSESDQEKGLTSPTGATGSMTPATRQAWADDSRPGTSTTNMIA